MHNTSQERLAEDVDTVRIPVLVLKPVDAPKRRPSGVDPYNQAEPLGVKSQPRRTLDDMRRLSAAIKRNRACQDS